jgi:hypothetical protein
MKKITHLLIGVLISAHSFAQSYTIPKNPALEYLYNTNNEIPTISNVDNLFFFKPNLKNWNTGFSLIKNKNGLFALLNGTGQVYKASRLDQKNISFTRIDSTMFFGYNFNSINFSYDGIINSFGGYGFWYLNGHLRRFKPGGEWVIEKINKTYGTLNQFYCYQPKLSKIYYVEFMWNEDATENKTKHNSVIEFDIKKRENKLLGKVNPRINLGMNFTLQIPSLNGTIGYNKSEMLLFNFSSNKVYKLINKNIKDELTSLVNLQLTFTFEDEGKLYYSFDKDTTLRSLSISIKDFKEEPYPLYISDFDENIIWIVVLIIILILSTTLIIVYIKRRKINNPNAASFIEEQYSVDLTSNEFNTIENSIINKLIEKSNQKSHLTVDELNSYLGIKKKTIEIQKRVRTEAINRINHKFNIKFNIESTFIERTRSIEDRRYFNYIINKENATIYLGK